MSTPKKIAVVVGSLRKDSINKKVARALIELQPATLALELVEIGTLPLYNQDLDTDQPPAAWTTFRDQVRKTQGLLFVTPEYNRSVPGALKNAIDVGSRPYGKSIWEHKPAGIISATPGNLGAFGANHHLRQSFVFLNVLALQQPEAYLSAADKLFDASGKLSSDSTRDFLTKYLGAFSAWVDKHS